MCYLPARFAVTRAAVSKINDWMRLGVDNTGVVLVDTTISIDDERAAETVWAWFLQES